MMIIHNNYVDVDWSLCCVCMFHCFWWVILHQLNLGVYQFQTIFLLLFFFFIINLSIFKKCFFLKIELSKPISMEKRRKNLFIWSKILKYFEVLSNKMHVRKTLSFNVSNNPNGLMMAVMVMLHHLNHAVLRCQLAAWICNETNKANFILQQGREALVPFFQFSFKVGLIFTTMAHPNFNDGSSRKNWSSLLIATFHIA